MKTRLAILITALLLFFGCGQPPSERGHKKILVLGDSLTEGQGLDPSKVYPALLEKLIREKDFPDVTVTADGISGATSDNGLDRLNARLAEAKYDILILELGANDGLNGKDLNILRKNLTDMIQKAKGAGCQVLLAGMKLPPTNGLSYMGEFKDLFPDLAKEQQVRLIPFLLEDVAGKPSLNLDGVHPNEAGHAIVAQTVLKYLEPML